MRDITDLARVKRNYLVYLRVEKGLSENTSEAYRDDVDKLTSYLADVGVAVERATTSDLDNFVAALHENAPRMDARRGLSRIYRIWNHN